MNYRLFLLPAWLITSAAMASVFGDGNPENGVEDARQNRSEASIWYPEYEAVGKLRCDGQIEGSGVLLNIAGQPVILSAAHVLDQPEDTPCKFESVWTPTGGIGLNGALGMGKLKNQQQLPMRYEQDWILASVNIWSGWTSHALKPKQIANEIIRGQAHLVGFDQVSERMVVHKHCDFGPAEDTVLLRGSSFLFWDDCHSSGGASGGALFVETPEGLSLLGIRVGSLYSLTEGQFPPQMGAVFDLQGNINVTRAITDILN